MNASPLPRAISLLLVDDSELVRRGIKSVLASQTVVPMHVIGEAGTVATAVAECARLKPDVVLLDLRLPDGSGLDACRKMLQERPETRIIVLTAHSNDNLVYDAVTAGA